MKQRFIALLLAVCIACTMLVVPASASSANTAVQAAVMLGGLTSEQPADAALTRGQLAKLLAAFSPYRESAAAQGSAGTFPLSEIETRSVVTFLLENPNIYVVNSMDTRVPMHLRAPSTSAPEERMYPEDLEWYEHFDQVGKSITGYEKAGDVYVAYNGDRTPTPLFGHGPDFGYFYYGAIWYGDEIWDNGKPKEDYNNDGEKDELDQLIWDERENQGRGFTNWIAFQHPTLGAVEIGGWDPKFFSQNAPSGHVEPWIKNEALFNLEAGPSGQDRQARPAQRHLHRQSNRGRAPQLSGAQRVAYPTQAVAACRQPRAQP